MSINFIWKYDYSVGSDIIDEQHRGIFDLANNLPDKLADTDIKKIVMQLFRYTREHFKAEEEMMLKTSYPKLTEHKNLHTKLITKLSKVSTHPLKNDKEIHTFKKFIYDWIIDHILNEDKDFFDYVKTASNRN